MEEKVQYLRLKTCQRDETFRWSVASPMSRDDMARLFRIAAGLESIVPGEGQILGQLRAALAAAKAEGSVGPELERIVEGAVACARKIRAEVNPCGVVPSVASAAIARLEREFGVEGKRAFVIGSGVVASLAVKELTARGVAAVSVTNRTSERTAKLVQEYGVRTVDYAGRMNEIASSDIVVGATASPHLVLERGTFVLNKPTAFVDLAVPHDIDPAIAEDPFALYIDLASLKTEESEAERARLADESRRIIDEAVEATLVALKTNETRDGAALDLTKIYRIGTRGSKLAMAQANEVKARLEAAHPGLRLELRVITTKGDRVVDRPIAAIGGNAVFTAEIERALFSGEIDIAVHSMKDLPSETTPGLVLAKAWTREDSRDALVSRDGSNLAELKSGAVVATGSVRRTELLRRRRPDLEIVDIRGNVDTRLRKLFEPQAGERRLDAIVLAAAGLKRLGKESAITEYLDPSWMIPAANQGQLAIELRDGDRALKRAVDALGDGDADVVADCERAFLAETGADCHLPVAAHARIEFGRLRLDAGWGDGERFETVSIGGGDLSSPRYLAQEAAMEIRRRLSGRVALVGAGPGDADLITVKGLKLLRAADAVVYDRLISAELLKETKADCRLFYVGKANHSHVMPQEKINSLLANLSLRHRLVVRLKGGDPFVFGRGGEEKAYLEARGIRCEVVPGVSSAIAAPESFGIPVTHRGVARALHVFTAHDRGDALAEIDYSRFTEGRETCVFLMGLAHSVEIARRFIAAGRPKSVPVAIISCATLPDARMKRMTLGELAEMTPSRLTGEFALVSPATLVIGDVVRLAGAMADMDSPPA